MSAAEYFSDRPMAQLSLPPYQVSTSHPQGPLVPQAQPNTSLQVQTQPAPPPYQVQDNQKPGVHFAPTPVELHQRHSFSGQSRPDFSTPLSNYSQHLQPYQQPYQQPYVQNNSSFQSRPSENTFGTSPQRPQYLAPHMRPYANPNASQYSLENGYSSDPEPHRRKHKRRERRDSDEPRSRTGSASRSANADAFVGAASGGLIGDLIFPGLGTIGGAALGWIGGKDYGKHRKERETRRERDQRMWEEKHGTREHRSWSRGGDSRDPSIHIGDRERRRSYESRGSHY